MAERLSNKDMARRIYRKGVADLLKDNKAFRQFLWTYLVNSGMFAPTAAQDNAADHSYWLGRHSLAAEMLSDLVAAEPRALALLSDQAAITAIENSDPPPEDDNDQDRDDPS